MPSYLDDYSFSIENFQSLLEELYPLWRAHHNELVGGAIALQPNVEQYIQLEKGRRLVIFTVRDKSAELVGYAFFILSQHRHRTQVIGAENDLLFLSKLHRKGWLATKFMQYFEKILFAGAVTQITMRTKSKASFAPVLVKGGYKQEETSYIKRKV